MNKRSVPGYLKFLISLFFLIIINGKIGYAQDGEAIFKANCSSCHAVQDKVVGPALKGISTRRNEEWLLKWVKNSGTVIKSGDEYAVKLFKDNNSVPMPPMSLKDDEIKAIFAYIKTEESKPTAGPGGPAVPGAPVEPEKPQPVWLYLIIAITVLILLATVLKKIQDTLAKVVRHKAGLPEPPHMSPLKQLWHWMRHNKKLVAVLLIVFTLYGSVKGWYALMAIGISQGYTPDQPIAFSHTLHAGDMQIQCIYCHSGAERGKVAGVPSANVCMNCHKFVRKGPTTGTTEIAKIYKALDYDPDKGTYGTNTKPLQWVRVHNLPDLAYFNHAQHVAVGKVQCQTCHGEIQGTMTVATQFAPLTMQWCIDCHKKTQVKMAGNAYYADYHKKLLTQLGSDSLITVEKIGGTECARCHY